MQLLSFILGVITGIILSTLIVSTLMFFRKAIEQKINMIQKNIENAGPRPRGFIIEPKSDADELRDEIIAKNKAKGQDTPIEDLM